MKQQYAEIFFLHNMSSSSWNADTAAGEQFLLFVQTDRQLNHSADAE